jgi:hypothetical protein
MCIVPLYRNNRTCAKLSRLADLTYPLGDILSLGDLQQLLAQGTPWGLSVGQTGAIFVIAAVLLVSWVVVHTFLRLGTVIFRLGCAALMIFVCGIVSFMVLYNLSTK